MAPTAVAVLARWASLAGESDKGAAAAFAGPRAARHGASTARATLRDASSLPAHYSRPTRPADAAGRCRRSRRVGPRAGAGSSGLPQRGPIRRNSDCRRSGRGLAGRAGNFHSRGQRRRAAAVCDPAAAGCGSAALAGKVAPMGAGAGPARPARLRVGSAKPPVNGEVCGNPARAAPPAHRQRRRMRRAAQPALHSRPATQAGERSTVKHNGDTSAAHQQRTGLEQGLGKQTMFQAAACCHSALLRLGRERDGCVSIGTFKFP